MRSIFEGWRRKTGGLLLALACAISSGWMRSLVFQDSFTVSRRSGAQFRVVSASQHLVVASIIVQAPSLIVSTSDAFWTARRIDFDGWLFTSPETIPIYFGFHGRSFWCNRQVVDYGQTSISVTKFHVPYWSIAVPLTLLSGYLLFWKPRNRVGTL